MPPRGHILLPQYSLRTRTWRTCLRRGRVFEVAGREVEVFSIGVLARALGRVSRSISRWEDLGYFPKPLWVLPEGRQRCYSKQQIANVRAAFVAHGLRRHATRADFEAMWAAFFLPGYSAAALQGDVL